MPIWSKLKKQLTGYICDGLKDRVGIYATRYRGTHDQEGKAWIELDKKVIFEANTLEWIIEHWKVTKEIRQINNCTDYRNKDQAEGYSRAWDDAEDILMKKHKMQLDRFYEVLNIYLNTSFEDSLQSKNDLIRILCLLDRRLGKHRLQEMVIRKDDCEAVKILYSERCRISNVQIS